MPARCSPSSPTRAAERYDLPVNASGAAWNAYERGKTPAVKAAALVVLSDALKRRSYWRPAIDALKSSLSLVDDAQVREAYDALVAEHGFRIVEYKVDADSAQPRLCIQFSERLAPGQVDWSQYLKVDGKDPQAVTAEARQICLDGLAHGKRYEVQVREGLPSAIASETLAKTAELAIYVKDRAPPCARRAAATCCPTAASRASRWSPSTPTRSTSRSTASATAALPRRCRAATSPSRSPPTTSPT